MFSSFHSLPISYPVLGKRCRLCRPCGDVSPYLTDPTAGINLLRDTIHCPVIVLEEPFLPQWETKMPILVPIDQILSPFV